MEYISRKILDFQSAIGEIASYLGVDVKEVQEAYDSLLRKFTFSNKSVRSFSTRVQNPYTIREKVFDPKELARSANVVLAFYSLHPSADWGKAAVVSKSKSSKYGIVFFQEQFLSANSFKTKSIVKAQIDYRRPIPPKRISHIRL